MQIHNPTPFTIEFELGTWIGEKWVAYANTVITSYCVVELPPNTLGISSILFKRIIPPPITETNEQLAEKRFIKGLEEYVQERIEIAQEAWETMHDE